MGPRTMLLLLPALVLFAGCDTLIEQPIRPEDISTEGLPAAAMAGLPEAAFDSLTILLLENTISEHPLWIVHSTGMLNWDLDPHVDHFLAVFTLSNSYWIELDRIVLDDTYESPDYMFDNGVSQVSLTDDFIWLSVEGGVGAHGGTYQLITFDLEKLISRFSAGSSRPAFTWIENLPADSIPDLLVDNSDPYVFFYASGVSKPDIRIYRWDSLDLQMIRMQLQDLPPQAGESLREDVARTVELAEAGLWLQASQLLEDITPVDGELGEQDRWILQWNAAIIAQNLSSAEGSVEVGYPLLSNLFYGNYQASIGIMNQYSPDQIFSDSSSLIEGSVAEGWTTELSAQLLDCTGKALAVEPELAGALFMRAWGTYLSEPDSPEILADVSSAALLEPDEQLFTSSEEFLSR